MFVAISLLTIGIWLSDPAYSDTNPDVDLGFFALGGLLHSLVRVRSAN